jgi:pyruvate kinase
MILADLPGPKIRIGRLAKEPVDLEQGSMIVLTTREVEGTVSQVSVNYERLTESLSEGSLVYLNDGFIQLQVEDVQTDGVLCRVLVGGSLLSYKGVNLPGAPIFVDPVSERDLQLVRFGLDEGVDAFGLSFVERAADILKVRDFITSRGGAAYVVAKIERAEAVEHLDEIIAVADGVMVARGDLGVQVPIEQVPAMQKILIRKANLAGRPVITATQMLLSMTDNVRPTRAEVSDVANAILDGSDALMLSEETAIGRYPVETVLMMARIATATEQRRKEIAALSDLRALSGSHGGDAKTAIEDVISLNAIEAARALPASYIVAPTKSGDGPRSIARFKPGCWVLAPAENERVRRFMGLSYGVLPLSIPEGTTPLSAEAAEAAFPGLAAEGNLIIVTGNESTGEHSLTMVPQSNVSQKKAG